MLLLRWPDALLWPRSSSAITLTRASFIISAAININYSPCFACKGMGRYLQAAFHLLSCKNGITQPFPSKLSFTGKPSCLGKEMSPGKMFSAYKARRAILVLYARNNKDKLLDKCGMPSILLRPSLSRQKDRTKRRRPGNVLSLKQRPKGTV